ncbi:MAG: TIR domain-containing protein [Haliscomenobacteraceae bacterium CHB4]|nr:hypothetical protein [Saprospiraceae bacterium]MCE7924797.1 TIR domain-containing protein [Haliscomenobacteraceae bacterium CHB4]
MGNSSVAVFVLFHDQDKLEKDTIVRHLSVLKRDGKIYLWEEGFVLAGENTEQLIRTELEKADIVLFLVSVESVDSDRIWKVGVERSLERQNMNQLIFIPVIVRDCVWEETLLANFKPLPENGKPISHWTRIDEPCKQVAVVVKKHVEKIIRQKQSENKQQGAIPSEFKEINAIFEKMPDKKIMNHILFADQEGKPASAAHFSIYAEMLKTIHAQMLVREAYNFYFDNLTDAKKVEEIGASIKERSELLKIDVLSLGLIAEELEEASRQFRLDFGVPENRKKDNWQSAKMMFVEPFCNVILKNANKLATLSKFSVNIDFPDLSSN